MTYTSVSSKFQVVIPKAVREKVGIKVGQKFAIYERGGVIHLIPKISLKNLRGCLKDKGITLNDLRDKSDRPL